MSKKPKNAPVPSKGKAAKEEQVVAESVVSAEAVTVEVVAVPEVEPTPEVEAVEAVETKAPGAPMTYDEKVAYLESKNEDELTSSEVLFLANARQRKIGHPVRRAGGRAEIIRGQSLSPHLPKAPDRMTTKFYRPPVTE